MSKETLGIHSENILPIIKKWLYSDKDIFVRELVSNACDAIRKVKILRDQGKTEAQDEEFKITLTIDKEARTLTFTDTGIGMDAEEVKTYIAQIAFSGAEAFMEKYESNDEKDQFIGHFGLGFYSSYMVAHKVEINTLSYKKNSESVFWSCDGSAEYTIEKGSRTTRGTEIILHISEGDEEFLEETTIKAILKRYCTFLHYPIFLGEEKINEKEPLWVKSPSDCKDEDYLEFYRHLYPMQEDPLFWIHLNVDYPFNLQGILYFPKLQPNIDLKKSSIQLYCNRVFVSDHVQDIIPEYLMPLRGVIDSPDIPLNVSRSSLQMDRTVRQLASHISKKVADHLKTLFKTNREKFLEKWEDLSLVVKLGAIEDQKFQERIKELLIWKTTEGEWLTAEEYIAGCKEKSDKKIYYTSDPHHNLQLIDIFKEKGISVLSATSQIDPYLINNLEQKLDGAKFHRIDSSLDEHLLDTSKEKTVLDEQGRTEAAHIADFIRNALSEKKVEVEAKSLATKDLPALLLIDENQRRFRDYMRGMDPKSAHALEQAKFVVNTNSPLVNSIQKMEAKDPALANEMVHQMYDMARLSQKELAPEAMQDFLQRTNSILESLAEKVEESC